MPLARGLALVIVLAGCGCAVTAKKVPTPAAELTGDDLARLPKPPGERFFLVLFGSSDVFRRPEQTHTWASLVRVRDGAEPDVHTISWLPTDGDIDSRDFTVKPGRNYGLHETMDFVTGGRQMVAVWGPYEVWHGFAHRFLTHKAFLDSGAVGYQDIDSRGEAARLGNGCNCIHAVSDMDPVYPRWRYPLVFYGKPATANVVRRFMHTPIFIDPPTAHDWLLPQLRLEKYRLQKRRYVGLSVPYRPGVTTDLDARAPLVPDLRP